MVAAVVSAIVVIVVENPTTPFWPLGAKIFPPLDQTAPHKKIIRLILDADTHNYFRALETHTYTHLNKYHVPTRTCDKNIFGNLNAKQQHQQFIHDNEHFFFVLPIKNGSTRIISVTLARPLEPEITGSEKYAMHTHTKTNRARGGSLENNTNTRFRRHFLARTPMKVTPG